MKPHLTPVDDSTAIVGIGYDSVSQVLFVRWHSGDTYAYADVPPLVHRILMKEERKGRYVNSVIKPRYAAREVYE
jgi:hypothetical protein